MLSIVPSVLADCDNSSCDCEYSSRSYMAIRPLFQSASPELVTAMRADRTEKRVEGCYGSFQVVALGSKSKETEDVQRYFMPFCKTELIVDEQNSFQPGASPMDLRSTHFNVLTVEGEFRSKISLEPKQSVFALGLYWRKGFWRNEEKNRQWFFSLNSPLTHIENDMILREEVINPSGGANLNKSPNAVNNMTEAFVQSAWNFGKIGQSASGSACDSGKACKNTCESNSLTRFADIEAKLGIQWVDREPCHLESYVGMLIPTGNRPDGRYLFEPIIGQGKHFGLFFGGSFGVQIWANEAGDRTVRVETSSHSQYLFKKQHVRAIDLAYKPWSRYQEVYANKAQAQLAFDLSEDGSDALLAQFLSTPGINVFTLPVDVTPGYATNTIASVVLSCDRGFQGELGYNIYARRSECLKLACPWQVGPALKHFSGAGNTNPVRNMTGQGNLEDDIIEHIDLDFYEQNQIQESDLDLNSATQPALISHTYFGTLGYRWDDRDYPTLLSAGGSYEFSKSSNAMLDRWVIWAKLGVSF